MGRMFRLCLWCAFLCAMAAPRSLAIVVPEQEPLNDSCFILSGRVTPSLGLTGGVHTGLDAVKGIMSGAHAAQMVSALPIRGPEHLRKVREEVEHFLEENEYVSLAQMLGNMSLLKCPDPKAYEQANYAHILSGWGR